MPLIGRKEADAAEEMQKAIEEAQRNIQEGFERSIGYMQPYYDVGTKSLTDLSSTLSSWLGSPIDTYNQIMSQWSGSPGYQQQTQAAIDASNAAAAASGMLGSGAQQTALQQQAQQLASADQERFFKDISSLGKGYLTGQEYLTNLGFQSGSKMGGWSAQEAEDLAQLADQMGFAKAQEAMTGWRPGTFGWWDYGAFAPGGMYAPGGEGSPGGMFGSFKNAFSGSGIGGLMRGLK